MACLDPAERKKGISKHNASEESSFFRIMTFYLFSILFHLFLILFCVFQQVFCKFPHLFYSSSWSVYFDCSISCPSHFDYCSTSSICSASCFAYFDCHSICSVSCHVCFGFHSVCSICQQLVLHILPALYFVPCIIATIKPVPSVQLLVLCILAAVLAVPSDPHLVLQIGWCSI